MARYKFYIVLYCIVLKVMPCKTVALDRSVLVKMTFVGRSRSLPVISVIVTELMSHCSGGVLSVIINVSAPSVNCTLLLCTCDVTYTDGRMLVSCLTAQLC